MLAATTWRVCPTSKCPHGARRLQPLAGTSAKLAKPVAESGVLTGTNIALTSYCDGYNGGTPWNGSYTVEVHQRQRLWHRVSNATVGTL